MHILLTFQWKVPCIFFSSNFHYSFTVHGFGNSGVSVCQSQTATWFLSKQQIYIMTLKFKGILPKGPYLPCVSMAGRALLAGYHQIMYALSIFECWQPTLLQQSQVWPVNLKSKSIHKHDRLISPARQSGIKSFLHFYPDMVMVCLS